MAHLKRVSTIVSASVLVGLILCLALTWNSFPGGWIKNRLGLGGDGERRAAERGREFTAAHPGMEGKPRIVIRKSERKLILFLGEREAWTAKVGLGGAPEGRKTRKGDRRPTPEGAYRSPSGTQRADEPLHTLADQGSFEGCQAAAIGLQRIAPGAALHLEGRHGCVVFRVHLPRHAWNGGRAWMDNRDFSSSRDPSATPHAAMGNDKHSSRA